MSKSKIFIGIAISFAVGILAASAFNVGREYVYIGLALAAAVFALSFISNKKCGALSALFLFFAALGLLRLQISMGPNEYQQVLGSKQQLEGYIVDDVAIKNNLQTIIFCPKNFNQNIQLTAPLTQQFFYGDWVVVEGKIQEPKNYGDFDYQKYLQRYNIYAVEDYPQILILKTNQLNPVKNFLLKIKVAFTKRLTQLFNEPQNSLLVGILIGGHGSLPQTVVQNFNNTGVSHIIAVSGFNITIIISALAALAYVIGRRASFWLALVTIAAFVIITGASASVVRAAIMGFLLLLALNIGRQYSIAPALFFAALVMLIINPKILFWDVGFQLSFAATLGIIYFMPVLNRLCEKFPQTLGIKTLILTTLSAIIATLPIILFNFGTLSFSAPLVNLLILPFVPATMLFGFLSVLPFVGPGFALVSNWLLLYILKITEVFSNLPYSYLSLQISIWVFWLLTATVFAIYFGLNLIIKANLKVHRSDQNK